MAVSRVLTGTVASIDAATGRPLVTVARRFGIGRTLGPCPIVAGPWAVGAATEAPSSANTGAASAGTAHTHTIGHTHGLGLDLAAGDTVLVLIAEDGRAVVAGRLI